ncbi:Abi family protein [Bacillus velezensis]|uniref:Abi family protein n=1 Tax=Bacillus velezensis TaxID=492670 RepID=UPI001C0006C8|nr:Abi family protein [Bacillus velezensis]MBT9286580.1 Abi family protein [Bacillus velezensis]MDH5842679.1 Abi family protein [Bacillus velezensis]
MTTPQPIKVFNTHSEQLEKFKTRGLRIEDESLALKTLTRINYYRLTGYMLSMKDGDKFYEDASFNKALRHYEFDTKLRRLLLKATEYIEIVLRSQLAYKFSEKYDGLGYKDSKNFYDEEKHQKFLVIIERKITESKELFVLHHKKTYDNQLPLWVAIELFSMDMLSKFFKNMITADKKDLSNNYYGVNHSHLGNWLYCLTNIRNISAHYSRLYNKNFHFSVKLFNEVKLNSKKLVSVFYILKKMLPPDEWRRFLDSFLVLTEEYGDVIEMHHMGFYDNWKEYIN